MQNAELNSAAASVPQIEVLDQVPEGARKFAGPFRPDESSALREMLKGLRDRSQYVVAPDSEGIVNIYRKAKPLTEPPRTHGDRR